ncbi:MAG: DUF4412 domain-containing protein [Woeseiaceae bacterium]|nr:DUF4412 domain-containing protein [Woeseiaceae bacterium]
MKTTAALPILSLLAASMSANAGTVYELATRTMLGEEIDRLTFYEDGDQSRMDQNGTETGSMTVIFKEEGFYVIDHAQKNYILMDKAMLDQISTQISEAMKQMEAQLAAMPPDQRAMVEEMMKSQMPGMGSGRGMGKGPVLDIKPVGEGRWKSYDCRKYEMLEDGVKIQEMCVTDYSEVDSSGALRESFREMGDFMSQLFESMPFGGQGVRNPLEMINKIDGFPVHAIDFENGVAVTETTLESAATKNIDAAMFELPAGYQQMDPFNP